MKETELRLRNYVLINGNKSIIAGINIDSVLHVELTDDVRKRKAELAELDIVKPIPLTEELLLKCEGFKLCNGGDYSILKKYDGDDDMYYRTFRVEKRHNKKWLVCMPASAMSGYSTIEFQYLHQLQNLYFDLTGNELEVKF